MLLDNFNTAPPEVMERLNSLFEDSPSLHLYEHSDGEVLSRAAETIHPNFRLFGTCNPGRISAHKVSSALLNRVIRICLLPLDAGLTLDNADEHDLMHILAHRFTGVHGGLELASLCVRFHARVAAAVAAGQVKLLGGYPLTARSMLFAAQGALQYMQASGCSPVAAAVKALLTTYLPGIAIRDQQLLLLRAAADTLTSPDLGSKLSYEQPAAGAAGTDTWQQQAAGLSSKLAQLEDMVAAACWALVPTVPGVAIAAEYAKQVSCYQWLTTQHRYLLLQEAYAGNDLIWIPICWLYAGWQAALVQFSMHNVSASQQNINKLLQCTETLH